MIKNKLIILILANFICFNLNAQKIGDSIISFFALSPTYAYQIPYGNLKDRFGSNSNIGGSVQFKNKKNFLFSADAFFIFGSNVKDTNLFENIKTSKWAIIDKDGKYADIRLWERGYYLGLKVGKNIYKIGPNDNSGIYFFLGGGFVQHKIKIETIGNSVPYLDKEYKKGYDRLSNGPFTSQFLGYYNYSNNNYFNFYIGIETIQGYTQSRRSFDYDLMKKDETKRLDGLISFRFGIMVPFYNRVPDDKYYY